MNKIDELRNYADNLRIKNEVKNDTLKRYRLLVDKLTVENKKLKERLKNCIKESQNDTIKSNDEAIKGE